MKKTKGLRRIYLNRFNIFNQYTGFFEYLFIAADKNVCVIL